MNDLPQFALALAQKAELHLKNADPQAVVRRAAVYLAFLEPDEDEGAIAQEIEDRLQHAVVPMAR